MLMRPSTSISDQPLPLWQSPLFAEVLRRLGTDAGNVSLGDVGQAVVLRRSFGPFGTISFTSRGPIWADGVSSADKVAALRASGLRIINAEAAVVASIRNAGFRRIFSPKAIAVLPLDKNLPEQLALCHGKWRNAYQQGLRARMDIVHRRFHAEKDAWLFEADRTQQKERGYRALPPGVVQMMAQIDRDAVWMSIAAQAGQPIAAMAFLRHGQMVTYHIGWTNAAGRNANAHHVMLIQAAQQFARKGALQMDLGLYQPKDAPGLARFKKRSGANVVSLGGTWLKVPLL